MFMLCYKVWFLPLLNENFETFFFFHFLKDLCTCTTRHISNIVLVYFRALLDLELKLLLLKETVQNCQ